MKTMRIEKNLQLHDTVDEVVSLYVSEALKYNREEDGIRAVGPLYIKGQYLHDQEQKPFQEVLDMDVLAPMEKLDPSQDFHLEITNYEGTPSDSGIAMLIQMGIHGLMESENKANEPVEVKESETIATPTIPPISELATEGGVDAPPLVSEEPGADISELEDLFEGDDNVYTSYRMIVARPEDNYRSIAQRYNVDENALRNTNRSKDIYAKTLVVLPFNQAE